MKEEPWAVLLAIVNVHLRFAHTGVSQGGGEHFTVGRKLPAIGLGRLTLQLVGQLHVVIIGLTGANRSALATRGPVGV